MTRAKLAIAHRQLAIRTHTLIEHLHVARTAHRFQTKRTAFLGVGKRIHRTAELFPMAASFPQRARQQFRRANLAEARATHARPHIIFENAIKRPAARVPENHAGTLFLLMKKIEPIAWYTMVDVVHDHVPSVRMSRLPRSMPQTERPETPKAPSVSGGAFRDLPLLLVLSRTSC
jgi:hypothetical protein